MEPTFTVTDEQLAQVCDLIESGRDLLPSKKLRPLQVIKFLAEGRSGKEIATIMEPFTPQAVSRIKRRLLKPQAVAAEIAHLRSQIDAVRSKANSSPRRRGRPGRDTLEKIREQVTAR